MRDQVNEAPIPRDFTTLQPTLREYGHAINTLISGLEVVATGSLPAANAALNGQLIIEDAGGSAANLVFYAKGLRFRISGGAAF